MNRHSNRLQFLIQFGYLGNYFHGVQPQKDVPTVGAVIYQSLIEAGKTAPRALQFSARTDKGVSALRTLATCWFRAPFDVELFISNLKRQQIPGILNLRASLVPTNIHARGSAKNKCYRYTVEENTDGIYSTNPLAWQIEPVLNIEQMKKAAAFLIGRHDFSAFRAAGCSAGSATKEIEYIKITKLNIRNQIHIDIKGDGFLRKMIRIIIGLLLEIGAGLRRHDEANLLLQSKCRDHDGLIAPAHGLMLWKINLNTELNLN